MEAEADEPFLPTIPVKTEGGKGKADSESEDEVEVVKESEEESELVSSSLVVGTRFADLRSEGIMEGLFRSCSISDVVSEALSLSLSDSDSESDSELEPSSSGSLSVSSLPRLLLLLEELCARLIDESGEDVVKKEQGT